MKYYNTKHQKNATRLTALIFLIIVLISFYVGPPYLDPPKEYGVAINFGTSELGNDNKSLANPKKADVSKTIEDRQPDYDPKVQSSISSLDEPLMTQDVEENISAKKQKDVTNEPREIEQEKQKEAERKRKEQEKKIRNLDQIIGGVKNARDNDLSNEDNDPNLHDNKNQLNGNPYAPSYFGTTGNGNSSVGFGLNGRGKPTKQIFKQDCNEYGIVVVKIEVNRQGIVTSATPGIKGSTNTHPCLLAPAKKIAKSHKWPSDLNAPSRQIGFVSINFIQNN